MTLFTIASKNFLNKKLSNSLCVLLMALGVAIIILVLSINKQLQQKLSNNIKGIDMVVGAKGSPLQLMLSAVYQIDNPTGNISLQEATEATSNPFVKKAIPIAMGDSYQGHRIVGCKASYWEHYEASLANGRYANKAMECVLGAQTAQKLSLRTGDTFASVHGLEAEGDSHDEAKYVVTGVLAPNNSVIDQLILTPLQSVWQVHEHSSQSNNLALLEDKEENHADEHKAEAADNDKQITAMLVAFRNPMGLMMLPRNINANTKMHAALPSIEINRLFSMLGLGIDSLQWLAYLIIFVAGISVFIMLYNSLKERRYELALMQSMGASRAKLFVMLLIEGLWVGLLGFLFGYIIGQVALFIFSRYFEKSFNYQLGNQMFSSETVLIFLACLAISLLASALPSLGVYKINISKTLAEG